MKARKASANGFICGQAGCMQLSLSILVFFMSLVAVDFLAPPHFTGPALWLSAFLPGSRLRLVQVSCNQLRRVLAPNTELSSASPRLACDFAAQPSSSVQQLSATSWRLGSQKSGACALLAWPPSSHPLPRVMPGLSVFLPLLLLSPCSSSHCLCSLPSLTASVVSSHLLCSFCSTHVSSLHHPRRSHQDFFPLHLLRSVEGKARS